MTGEPVATVTLRVPGVPALWIYAPTIEQAEAVLAVILRSWKGEKS